MGDLISRQAAIDELSVDAELLRRVLDDTDVVGAEREKYEWGLGLIESYIYDMKEFPSAQTEIVRCGECKYRDTEMMYCGMVDLIRKNDDWFCADGEMREE